MKVEYINHMGSDVSVANAARVSFDKESVPTGFRYVEFNGGIVSVATVDTRDRQLIGYLAKHGHWSPFAHTAISMRWKAPIFVARQLVKHQVGLTWNEVSRRYVKTDPELYWPEKYRNAADNVKQGSSDEEFKGNPCALLMAEEAAKDLVSLYSKLVEQGLCPEQARMFLPQNTYTEWIWTGSLMAWARVYKQRTDPTAQKETRDLVLTLDDICGKLFPVSWEALKEN
jgi:thymidylate synthase (FAD)